MKKCAHCNIVKEFLEFSPDNRSGDKYRCYCKKCSNLKNSQAYLKNRSKMLLMSKKYRDENKDKLKEYFSRKDIKDKRSQVQREYREKNKKKLIEKKKLYYICNKDIIKEKRKEKKSQIAEYSKNRKNSNPLLKLISNIRVSIYNAIKKSGFPKNKNTNEIVGCSFEEFKMYLESHFETWMSWENYGLYNGELNHGWDIDHIIPISTAKSEDEVLKLNHFSNLQPLCSKINRVIKKNKIDDIES